MKIIRIFLELIIFVFCLLINSRMEAGLIHLDSNKENRDIDTKNNVSTEKIFHSYFTSKGFINGKVEITELEVEITLKENQ